MTTQPDRPMTGDTQDQRLTEAEHEAVRRALHDAWLAVHIRRFDRDYGDQEVPEYAEHVVPDTIYNGTLRAERQIHEVAERYGIDYHALRDSTLPLAHREGPTNADEREALARALESAPDHGGWRAGLDRDAHLDLADAVLAAGFHRGPTDNGLRALLAEGIAAEDQPCRLDHSGDCQGVARVRAVLARQAAVQVLRDAADDPEVLEAARLAIEDSLIEWRGARRSQPLRNNGLVIAEKDGTPSSVIRFGPETAARIALVTVADRLAATPEDGA